MLIAVAVLFSAFALSQTVSSVEYAQKLCRTEDDCDWDHCCVEAETRIPGFNGICSTPTQRGEECNPDPSDKTEDGRFRLACPCDKGLRCQTKEGTFRNKIHQLYVCQP